MSCSDEHGHDHSHDGHDHDIPLESGPQDSLYSQIDLPHVTAMNGKGGPQSGQRVIKSWENREDEVMFCESDADDSLILKIPFISSISLRSITVKAGPSGYTPSSIKIVRSFKALELIDQFTNNPALDFSDAESSEPTQEFEAVESSQGVEYPVKAAKFAAVTSLILFFPNNVSSGDEEETTRIFYIGLRGSWKAISARPGAIVYESAARPTDHKLHGVNDVKQAWGGGY